MIKENSYRERNEIDAESLSKNMLIKKSGWAVKKRLPPRLTSAMVSVISLPANAKGAMIEKATDYVKTGFSRIL